MAVDPATRPTARRPDRPVTANRHQGGRPAATRPATEARWFHGRRTATSPRPPRGSRSEDRAHGRRPGCRQHRLRFYDDPNPIRHAPQSQSLSRKAAHLGDLLRISVRTDAKTPRGPLSNFQGPRGGHGHRRNERCSSRSRPYRPARGFQGRTTLTEKRELFPDPPAASSSSFRSPGRDKRAPNTRERFRVGFRNTDRIPSRPMGDSKTPSPVVRGSLPGLRID
ncbi:hypothetical protein ACI65C_013102 [Semiaphis heraclei]